LAKSYEIEIVQLSTFEQEVWLRLTRDGLQGLMMHLALHPEAGDVIEGANGLRQLRWAIEGAGIQSGVVIFYYFRDLNTPLYLLALYGNQEEIDLSAAVRSELGSLVDDLVRCRVGVPGVGTFIRIGEGA
jgi:hypothetical protein